MLDPPGLDFGPGEDFFLPVLQQLAFISAPAARGDAFGWLPGRTD